MVAARFPVNKVRLLVDWDESDGNIADEKVKVIYRWKAG